MLEQAKINETALTIELFAAMTSETLTKQTHFLNGLSICISGNVYITGSNNFRNKLQQSQKTQMQVRSMSPQFSLKKKFFFFSLKKLPIRSSQIGQFPPQELN